MSYINKCMSARVHVKRVGVVLFLLSDCVVEQRRARAAPNAPTVPPNLRRGGRRARVPETVTPRDRVRPCARP